MRLAGKVALITGAGGAMGRVGALRFAREGAAVVAADLNGPAAEETAHLVTAAGGRAIAVAADVSSDEQVAALVRRGVAAFGGLHILYNNAGVFLQADHSVLDTDPEVWDRVQQVNLKSMYLVCRHGVPHLQRAGGSIVNVASFVALVGCSVPQDAYTASKGGVIALTKSLAVQFGPDRVRANAICPGPIETPLLTEWLLSNPEARALRLARIPLGRFGRPEDVVSLALFLASDEAAWMTGSVVAVDGGITSNYF